MDPSDGFYILNPSKDLTKTQNTFLESFQARGWSGIAGTPPTAEQFAGALQEHGVFVYCGHNSGEQYLARSQMGRQLDAVNAVSLLMGCSSAAQQDLGAYEPYGIVQAYMRASCPAVVGNLFDVTDSDIDRYLQSVLQRWLNGGQNLIQCVADARSECKLKYLVGAAPVCYGLPMFDVKN